MVRVWPRTTSTMPSSQAPYSVRQSSSDRARTSTSVADAVWRRCRDRASRASWRQAYALRDAGKDHRPGAASSTDKTGEETMRRIAALLFAVLMASQSAAQERYPSQPITLISPYPPGGATDFLARTLAEGLKGRLSQSVIVQNIGGAGGTVGTLQAAKAKPDGYTLLLHHIGMSTIPALYKKLAFDPLAAFEFIGVFAEAPMMFMARREFAPNDFAELVAYARANRERATVAAAGMGSVTHLC